jgi:hypothetical protein
LRRCPPSGRDRCPAYRLNQGHMCWLLTEDYCRGDGVPRERAEFCRDCTLFQAVSTRPDQPGGHPLCGMPRPARALSTR